MLIKLLINILFFSFIVLEASEVKVHAEKYRQIANYVPLCKSRLEYVLDKANVNMPKSVQDIISQYYHQPLRNKTYVIEDAHKSGVRKVIAIGETILVSINSQSGSKYVSDGEIKIWEFFNGVWILRQTIDGHNGFIMDLVNLKNSQFGVYYAGATYILRYEFEHDSWKHFGTHLATDVLSEDQIYHGASKPDSSELEILGGMIVSGKGKDIYIEPVDIDLACPITKEDKKKFENKFCVIL